MNHYQESIAEILKEMGAVADPRHIEGLMRNQYGCLDHLSHEDFEREVRIGLACIAEDPVICEENARSHGL